MLDWLLGRQRARAESAERFGPYAIQRTIHDGEKAVVYEARTLSTGEAVAIKSYKPLYHRTNRRMRRRYGLPTEGEIGMRMNPAAGEDPAAHPVVLTRAFGNEFQKPSNPHFVVLEFLPGAKLQSLISTGHADLAGTRLALCRGAARGVEMVHARGMIHRDVCSDNFLVSPQGRVKLIDLGFCVPPGMAFEERTGTPSYMAPEQIRGEPLGPQTDIYAFGVVLFEVFTGRLPFTSPIKGKGGHVSQGRASQIMAQHLRAAPPRPTDLTPGLSPRIEQVILKCLEKRPEARFPSMAELTHELGLLRE